MSKEKKAHGSLPSIPPRQLTPIDFQVRSDCWGVASRAIAANMDIVHESLPTMRPAGHTPISAVQWRNVLRDAMLAHMWADFRISLMGTFDTLAGNNRQIGRRFRTHLCGCRQAFWSLAATCREISAFQVPPEQSGIVQVHTLSRTGTEIWDLLRTSLRHEEPVKALERQLADAVTICDNAVAELSAQDNGKIEIEDGHFILTRLFRLDPDRIGDGTQATFGGRITAAWEGKLPELEGRVRQALAHLLPPKTDYLPNPSQHLAKILMSQRPLVSHRAVIATWPMVLSRFEEDVDLTVRSTTWDYSLSGRIFSTHGDVQRVRAALHSDPEDEEVLRLVGHLYRMAVETYFRHTAASSLGILGDLEVATEVPSVNDLLLGVSRSDREICRLMGQFVQREWRNAVAHEDVYWDDNLDSPVLGGRAIDIREVYQSAEGLIAIEAGFQAGIALARAANSRLVDRLDNSANLWNNSEFLQVRVSEIFGVMGVATRDVRRKRDTVQVDVPELANKEFLAFCSIIHAARETHWIDAYWTLNAPDQDPSWRIDRETLSSAARITPEGPNATKTLYRPWSTLPLIAVDAASTGIPAAKVARTVCSIAVARLSMYARLNIHGKLEMWLSHQEIKRELRTAVSALEACVQVSTAGSLLSPVISAIEESLAALKSVDQNDPCFALQPISRLQSALGDVHSRYRWFVEA